MKYHIPTIKYHIPTIKYQIPTIKYHIPIIKYRKWPLAGLQNSTFLRQNTESCLLQGCKTVLS